MASKAARAAVPVSSSMPITMMPFLYQTRTLGGRRWNNAGLIIHGTPARAISSRSPIRPARSKTHTSLESNSKDPRASTQPHKTSGDEAKSGVKIRRTGYMHGKEPERFDSRQLEEDRPSIVRKTFGATTAKPDFDSTTAKQILIPWDTDPRERALADGDEANAEFEQFADEDSAEFDEYEYPLDDNEEDAISDLTRFSPQEGRVSTITPSEKQAFQKIFSDIFAKTQQKNGGPFVDSFDSFDELESELIEPDDGQERGKNPTGAKEELGNIMSNAWVSAVSAKPAGRKGISEKDMSREEKEIAVNRYPPALRAAAARAIGLDLEGKESGDTITVDEALDNERLERLRTPERDRVEALMRAARTDFELWAVMEEEVFPLISKLGLEDVKVEPAATPTEKKGKKSKAKNSSPDVAPEEGKETETRDSNSNDKSPASKSLALPSLEDGVSPLALYGPLYPSYLLLGLRLLDRSFAKPSPLTLSILPKIKSLGLISHVLGASTQLYNELILISWYRRDDFRGALNLLGEMEQFGLDWDKETLDAVNIIIRMQVRVRRGQRGNVLKLLWTFPEFAPGKFKTWRVKIQDAINERSEEGIQAY